MPSQPSQLTADKFKLQANQLEHDSFAQLNNIEVAGDVRRRERLRSARISELLEKNLHMDPDTGSLYSGFRSINCESCVQGKTQGVHLTDYCNKSCFFCPQRRTPQTCFTRQLNYYTPTGENDRKIIKLMMSNNSTGCGLTGGEPLVVLDKVIHYIRLLKDRLGNNFWIHLYTNGDFLDRSTLSELRDAGLDEIRINAAAVNYNLDKTALAREYIKKLLIEIPIIPKDEKPLTKMMYELSKLRIDGINMHELAFNKDNLGQMRKYVAAYPSFKAPFYLMNEAPVAGSEELIFNLLELALTEQFSYGIHYCHYRARIIKQNISKFHIVASAVKRPYERVDEGGLLEKLVVSEPGIADALTTLEKHKAPKEKIHLSLAKKRLETDIDYLEYLDPDKYETAIIKSLPFAGFDDVSIQIVK